MIDTNKVDHKTWQWRPPLTNHKPAVRELTNEKLRYMRATFLSSLSIVVSKYGTDYKESSIPRSHVRAVLGPGFILLSALNSSTQISSDYIYDHRNKSILWINELWLLAVWVRSQCFLPGWIWIAHCLLRQLFLSKSGACQMQPTLSSLLGICF